MLKIRPCIKVDDRWERIALIDDDIDGRDIQAYRVTWSWEPTENSSLWVMYNYSEEEDDCKGLQIRCV